MFVTATDTDVGKTFFSALFLRAMLRRGIKAGYFKPLASGCCLKQGILIPEDITFVEDFTDQKMDYDTHCPVRYQKPLAPLAAARLEEKPVDLDLIWNSFELLRKKYTFLLVEGIGGVMVPLKRGYMVLDMIEHMRFPAIVICRPSLGTINHTLLSLEALKERGIPIIGFITNGDIEEGDEAAITSPELIAEFSETPHLGHLSRYDPIENDPETFIKEKAGFIKTLSG